MFPFWFPKPNCRLGLAYSCLKLVRVLIVRMDWLVVWFLKTHCLLGKGLRTPVWVGEPNLRRSGTLGVVNKSASLVLSQHNFFLVCFHRMDVMMLEPKG